MFSMNFSGQYSHIIILLRYQYRTINIKVIVKLPKDRTGQIPQSLSLHEISHSDHHPRPEDFINWVNKDITKINFF